VGTDITSAIQNIYTSNYRSRVLLDDSRLNFFASFNPNSINLFEIEREQRRSRARTRQETLTEDRCRIRTPSRPRSPPPPPENLYD